MEIEAERGLTPFVGRERELALLQECYDAARTERGRMVFIVGEPGIGKSRLLFEFQRRLGDHATWCDLVRGMRRLPTPPARTIDMYLLRLTLTFVKLPRVLGNVIGHFGPR